MKDAILRSVLAAIQRGNLTIEQALAQLRAAEVAQPLEGTPEPEFARITALAQLFAQASRDNQDNQDTTDVQLGIGDDAAVLHGHADASVLSVDTAVEGVHFERAFASWPEIGARAFSAAISDLAAMGATPSCALCSLIVPPTLPNAAFMELNRGIARAALEYGCPVVGGNLSSTRGEDLSITTTVVGHLKAGRGLYRGAAQAGDDIYVTGVLGSAALGLALLQLGAAERGPEFVAAFRAPRARIAEGLAIVSLAQAHAAIDVSDGALQDLGHICEASGLGAVVEAARVPMAVGFVELARGIGREPLKLALLGGEDYELIYTVGSGEQAGPGMWIGKMVAGAGVTVVDERGVGIGLVGGFRHF